MDIFTIPGEEYDSNIYVICGDVPTIVDTGTGFYSKEISEQIKKIVNPSTITQIVLTHEHYDHVGGVADFIRLTGGKAKILASELAVSKLRTGKSSFAEMLGGVMPKITVDVALHDGEQIQAGDELFEVFSTPGHSPGSICLYDISKKTLISGDTVFAFGGFGRYDFPGGDFQVLVSSLERLALLDCVGLYPGHGPVVEKNGTQHVENALHNIRSMG